MSALTPGNKSLDLKLTAAHAPKTKLFIFQVVVSLGIMAILLWRLPPRRIGLLFQAAHTGLLVAAVSLWVPGILARSWRFKLLFDQPSSRLGLFPAMVMQLVGAALNLILPAGAGDVAKSYFGYRWSGVKERMISISILDKAVALFGVGVLGIIAALWQKEWIYIIGAIPAMLGLLFLRVLPVLVLRSSKWLQRVDALLRGKVSAHKLVQNICLQNGLLVPTVILSIMGWLITYLQLYLCLDAVDANVPFLYVISVSPLLSLIRLCPFTLGGMGTDEAAMLFFFAQAQASPETILAGAIIYRLLVIIMPGVLGLLCLMFIRRLQHQVQE